MSAVDPPRRQALLALLLLVPAPSLGALVAMILAPGAGWAQVLFLLSKLYLLAFPAVWLVLVEKRRVRMPKPSCRGLGLAALTGLAAFVAIWALYLARGDRLVDLPSMRQTVNRIGLGHPWVYLVVALYWCAINSILEEYIWRWFVFTRCRVLFSSAPAILVSALLFTLHHIVALSSFLPLPATLLASFGVLLGGSLWSWIYLRTQNIYAAYASHVLADIAVFTVGWSIVFA